MKSGWSASFDGLCVSSESDVVQDERGRGGGSDTGNDSVQAVPVKCYNKIAQ